MEDMDVSGDSHEGPTDDMEYIRYTRSGLKLHVSGDQRKRVAVLYGEIPNVPSGTIATSRNELRKLLVHTAYTVHVCTRKEGIVSIILDKKLHFTDEGTDILLHGYRGPDAENINAGFYKGFRLNVSSEKPIRVIRSHDSTSVHRPSRGYRYDGLYSVKILTLDGMTNYVLTRIKTPNENIPPELISSSKMVQSTLLMVQAMKLNENEPIDVKTEMLETSEYNSMLESIKSESTDELEEMNESDIEFDDENDLEEFNNERCVQEFDEYHNPEFEKKYSSTELVADTKNNIVVFGNQSINSGNPGMKLEPGEEIGDNDERFLNSDTDSGVDFNMDTVRNRNDTHQSNLAVRGLPPKKSVLSDNEFIQMTYDKAKKKGGLVKKFSDENTSFNTSKSNKLPHKCLYNLTVAEYLGLVSPAYNSTKCCPCSQPSNERRIMKEDMKCFQAYVNKYNPNANTALKCLVDDFNKRIDANSETEDEVNGCLKGKRKFCPICAGKKRKHQANQEQRCPCMEYKRKEHPLLTKGPLIIPEDEENNEFLGFEE